VPPREASHRRCRQEPVKTLYPRSPDSKPIAEQVAAFNLATFEANPVAYLRASLDRPLIGAADGATTTGPLATEAKALGVDVTLLAVAAASEDDHFAEVVVADSWIATTSRRSSCGRHRDHVLQEGGVRRGSEPLVRTRPGS